MSYEYPIKFDAKDSTAKAPGFDDVRTIPISDTVTAAAAAASPQECKEWVIAEIGSWPEGKGTTEQSCVDLGWPIGRVCAELPRLWQRTCTKYVGVDVCYPSGVWSDVEECLKGAAVAAVVAAVIASPEASGPTFEVALKGCLAAKGAAWADQVTATPSWRSKCGDWHPI